MNYREATLIPDVPTNRSATLEQLMIKYIGYRPIRYVPDLGKDGLVHFYLRIVEQMDRFFEEIAPLMKKELEKQLNSGSLSDEELISALKYTPKSEQSDAFEEWKHAVYTKDTQDEEFNF